MYFLFYFPEEEGVLPGSRFTVLKLSMFFAAEQKFPVLKGKANEIRHFGTVLLKAFKMHMDRGDDVHKKIYLGLQLSVRIERIVDEHIHEYALPTAAHEDFLKCVFGFVQVCTFLGHHFHGQKVVIFNFTIKHHYLCHIALLSKFSNPGRLWCYSGEDLMNKIKEVTHACVHGTAPTQVCPKATKRYVLGLGYQLAREVKI